MNPRVHRSRVTHDRWLVSYADFITLLFAFFVVLYAFAKADQKKQQQISIAVDSAFRSLGVFPGSSLRPGTGGAGQAGTEQMAQAINAVMHEEILSPRRVKDDLEHIRTELQQKLASQIAQNSVSIQLGPDGLVISLREAGFFNSGSATPRPDTLATLNEIALSLSQTPYNVRIEGHTDNIPIHNDQFDSNWELSSARATHIARLFLDLHAMPPDRLSAAGYAEFHPVADNATAEGRADNRRVDLVVYPRSQINLAAPDPPKPTGPWAKITDDK